jgi:hypothetical protein
MTINILPHGVSAMRAKVVEHLQLVMPPLCDAARTQFNMDPHMMPYPKKYDAYDPNSADVYPTIGLFTSGSTRWTRVDINPAAEEVYEARFQTGIFLWVLTPEKPTGGYETPTYDQTIRLRDDMLALLRSALLSAPSFGSGGGFALDEATVRETYPDAIDLSKQNDRWAAGGMINCEIRVQESNFALPLGVANDVVVEVEPMQEEEQ